MTEDNSMLVDRESCPLTTIRGYLMDISGAHYYTSRVEEP
jgi:hypothetical protein